MKLKRENKGFSLVELIVVIAIFSVVAIAVGGFLYTANRTYSVSATELDIQEEAQLVANQLQEMVMDTALGISYQYTLLDASGAVDVGYAADDTLIPTTGDLSKKELFIYGRDCYYIIYWNKDDSKLYYVEYELDPASGVYVLANGMTADGVLLGEYVSQFSVDLSKLNTDRMVSFNIVFEKNATGERDYLVSKSVSLRNNVLVNKDKEVVWASSGTVVIPKADGISITPSTPQSLWPGETMMYSVNLTCSLGGVPNQSVNWAYESGDGVELNPNTKVSGSGVLQISPDEESSMLKLKATATGMDYATGNDITLTKDLEVNIKQIQSLEIINSDFEATTVAPGGTYTIDVFMQGRNISSMSATDAGGIGVSYLKGQQYVQLQNTQDLGGSKMRFTFKVDANAPEDAEIIMRFYALKEGFTDVTVDSATYKVHGIDKNLIGLTSTSGNQWLRLGSSKVQVNVLSDNDYKRYCNTDGTLKEGYYMKYTYQLYNDKGELVSTAYKTTTTNANVYTDYFTSAGSSTAQKSSVLSSSDKMFLTSGSVMVKAELMSNTAGSIVTVAETNEVEYIIPEAVIGFKRTKDSGAKTNMNLYITQESNIGEFYITFSQGFAEQNYKISYDMMKVDPSDLGSVNSEKSNLNDFKVAVAGTTTGSKYSDDGKNVITFTYGGLPQSVKVMLMNPNVDETGFYVPDDNSEWDSNYNGGYYYYINEYNRMYIASNGSAKLQVYEGREWLNGATYKYKDDSWYVVSNVEGYDYYVPYDKDEWTTNDNRTYYYEISSSYRMKIEWANDKVKSAKLQQYKRSYWDYKWSDVTSYSYSTSRHMWVK